MNLLLQNIRTLYTPLTPSEPLQKNTFLTLHNATIAIVNGKITWIGNNEQTMPDGLNSLEYFDASDYIALPGFVDCLTFPFFPLHKTKDLNIQPWQEQCTPEIIKNKFKHLIESLNHTSHKELKRSVRVFCDTALHNGTTTIKLCVPCTGNETTDTMLFRIANEIRKELLTDCHIACTIGTALQISSDHSEVLNWLLKRFLPYIKEHYTRELVLEWGSFNETFFNTILSDVVSNGFEAITSIDLFRHTNGILLSHQAARNNCVLASLPLEDDITLMQQHKTTALILPLLNLSTQVHAFSLQPLTNAHIPVALASGYNPLTINTPSMQLILTLACAHFGLSPEEALTAATLNSAKLCGYETTTGSIEIGKQADIILLRAHSLHDVIATTGINYVSKVIKNGVLLEL